MYLPTPLETNFLLTEANCVCDIPKLTLIKDHNKSTDNFRTTTFPNGLLCIHAAVKKASDIYLLSKQKATTSCQRIVTSTNFTENKTTAGHRY